MTADALRERLRDRFGPQPGYGRACVFTQWTGEDLVPANEDICE